eukprot:PLAT9076.1.p1 GENE.PLAT9076.1~~PLAT9076.1.p1  ORF type:complete len:660 (+),score=271.17 PLAT9076.1:265-1980(+)
MLATELLRVAREGGFWSYAAGVAYRLLTAHRVGGLSIDNYRTDLPVKKGLSSSAALCVIVARAFNRAYDLRLTLRGEMEAAYQGEILTPSRCGRMDQGCAFGGTPVLMRYDGDFMDVDELAVGSRPLHYVIVDLGGDKSTVAILEALQAGYPTAADERQAGVHKLLGDINLRITEAARQALARSDGERLGELMKEAQAAFDALAAPLCPEQLTSPLLHRLLALDAIQPLIWGGKGVGSQGDGTAQLLARGSEQQAEVMRIVEEQLGMACYPLCIQAGRRVRRAVIPCAGFASEFYPTTAAVPAALLPLVDASGLAKPAILWNVEELLAAGIEQVLLVVSRHDLPAFTRLFKRPLAEAELRRLAADVRDYAGEVHRIGDKVSFIVQEAQEGLGHAVLTARDAVGAEPFVLLLGDHVYRSTAADGRSCVTQLLDAFYDSGGACVALQRTAGEQVSQYGAATGVWTEAGRRLRLTRVEEKPTVERAREMLAVAGEEGDRFLTFNGLYILPPDIMALLEEDVASAARVDGLFQLTPALERLRDEQGMVGVVIEGDRFDFGTPARYADTLARLMKL